MNKLLVGGGVVLLGGIAWYAMASGTRGGADVEYRYGAVERGELVRSRSSTGVLVPLTQVDVKSKAGGRVIELRVEEGSVVKNGDVIAVIDPEDTRSAYEQAAADLTSAQTRVSQARVTAEMEGKNASIRVRDAQIALDLARINLAKAEERNRAQPTLTEAEVKTAEAALASAQENHRLIREVTNPQGRRQAETDLARARAALATAESEMERQQRLLERGFVAQSAVEQQRATLEAARSSERVAQQRMDTLQAELDAQLRASQARVNQAEEALRQARANTNQVTLTSRDLDQARKAVEQARIDLEKARSDQANVQLRRSDVVSAQASAVRSRVAAQNARVQLESTTVVAPREGVVTLKYLEEGTIIPPGTSTFAQGTSLVQLSDVTQMFVECAVDESDISSVKLGQRTRVIVEAYPGKPLDGLVRKIYPAAETTQSLTTVKVRVEILPQALRRAEAENRPLRPGMNATCEFLELDKKDVLILPQQAIQREDGKTFVKVKGADPMAPIRREVQLGESGNEGVEVLSGLNEGDEVVVAELDLKAMRERQERMTQAEQGGGLGSQGRGGPSQSRSTAGGGGRGGGAGGAGGGARGR
ncbi:MAG: HlyD family efflux transporter periplasmic adaptor subunit [Fimbriimonadaceae bacterium]|nr:HlyD family efflux transporter periplasmic adaptor subunit [Fimbriimonadaceae bacterium]QYK56999.1 MAG: HlyD family efflux transporter periplasmic adaptor subunit [Fimbriimonadaceae bacterium]